MHPDTKGAAKQINFQKTTKTTPRNTNILS